GNLGGGIYNGQEASATLTDCLIAGNTSSNRGAGIYNGPFSTAKLMNVTITGNTAGDLGGGFCAINVTSSMINCTITGNSAQEGDGGGVHSFGQLTAINTIVASQSAGGDIVGALQSASANNLVGDGAGMTGIENGNNSNQVGAAEAPIIPLLSTLGNYGG